MKREGIVVMGVGLLMLIYFILNCLKRNEESMGKTSGILSRSPLVQAVPANGTYALQPGTRLSAADSELVLTPRRADDDPVEKNGTPHPDYVWYTKPTSKGAIKNSNGEIIFQATDELPFVSMRSRANVSKIVVVSVNRNAFVIDPLTKHRVALPKKPAEEGAKGFENWEWIDNDTLIAEYHIEAKSPNGISVGCCEGHGIAETRLYAYNLRLNLLSRVILPENIAGTAFSISRVAGDGSIEVIMQSNHLIAGSSVGWFNLPPNR